MIPSYQYPQAKSLQVHSLAVIVVVAITLPVGAGRGRGAAAFVVEKIPNFVQTIRIGPRAPSPVQVGRSAGRQGVTDVLVCE